MMSDKTTEVKALAILRWFAEGQTGTSSKTLALASVGMVPKGPFGAAAPLDEGDSGRCEMLARMCPFVIEALPALIEQDRRWARWAPRIMEAAHAG